MKPTYASRSRKGKPGLDADQGTKKSAPAVQFTDFKKETACVVRTAHPIAGQETRAVAMGPAGVRVIDKSTFMAAADKVFSQRAALLRKLSQ